MIVEQAYNYRRVSATVCTAGVLSEAQIGALAGEGYRAVINLLPMDSQYALPAERELIAQQGLIYQYIPVDFDAPHKNDYREFERAMKALHGKKILVHCAANYRVSAFYAIYACRHLGWSGAAAQEHIASLWNPAEYDPWGDFIAEHMGDASRY